MRLGLTPEHRQFGDAVADLLEAHGGAEDVWERLVELGVPAVLVAEEHEGAGGDEVDLLAVLDQAGRAALGEPVVEAAVAARLLAGIGGELAAEWLPKLASGEALVVAAPGPYVPHADRAGLVLVGEGGAWYAVRPEPGSLTVQNSMDPLRRLSAVRVPEGAVPVAEGALAAEAFDRGAALTAVQLVGVARRLVDFAVRYAGERSQYGRPIGSFQGLQHQIADALVDVEFARPAAYKAAYALAKGEPDASLDASGAKALASDAALHAAKVSLQVHGAIGYTMELDLHRWLRRAWSLASAWGDASHHRRAVAAALIG
ncbi:acyl-CoA dehydrogenase family protein [Actinocorallia populi]|uniref:acyl-CoA dehydrogenase family protein n=1 Tax=Actinocorallia populi TaxID=2079200 RepID=UPI000D096DAC|nr:acyl-CoA dehydrogenase family protein [Actinocorallia populi]